MTTVDKRRARAALFVAALTWGGCHRSQAGQEIVVSAAISLKDPLSAIATDWEAAHPGWHVAFNLGASGELLRQIQAGAPADVFVSASPDEVQALVNDGHADGSAVVTVAHNRIALIVPAGGPSAVASWESLADASRIAVGDPDTVPAGRYARTVLQQRNLWDGLQPRLVLAENVSQVLTYVAQGSVQAGLAYVTDAASSADVRVVATADGPADPLVTYPAVPLEASPHLAEAASFCAMLASPSAQTHLRADGFLP
jgi:molybdate transport system substrate-binding protein